MRYPVDYINITQGYHQGKCLDFGWGDIKHGYNKQPVYACDDGIVKAIENQPLGGNVIYLVHNNGMCSCYAHLSKVKVKVGQKVSLGENIATMGNTGKNMPYHLHFGLFSSFNVRYKNSTIDPFQHLEKYDNQVVKSKTQTLYGNKIKEHKITIVKYVYNVDDEGLVVHKIPNGANTGKLLKAGTKVFVYETQGYWSKIGSNEWVWSLNLSNTKPKVKIVSGVVKQPLNVRDNCKGTGKIVGSLYNGDTVQVYKTKNGWSKVSKTEERWCSSNFLK